VTAAATRPSRRELNDERLRDAALAELIEHGADALGPTRVARRAGLTTGAVYNRFEDTTEMVVDLWSSRCRDDCRAIVDLAMVAMGPQGDQATRRELIDALASPSPSVSAGLELMVMAHRDDALAEVVIPDGTAFVASHGVTRSSDPDRMAHAAFVLSLVIGLLLLGSSGVSEPDGDPADEPDWDATLGLVAHLLARTPDVSGEPLSLTLPDLPTLDEIDDDPTRARLLVAATEVIGRVGLQRATVTRIGRRAGMTHGAIYGLFGSKEELVAAAAQEITARVIQADRAFNQEQYERMGSYGAAAAAVMAGLGDERRRAWQLFRLECHLAQRHDPTVGAALDTVYARIMAHDAVTFTQSMGMDAGLARGWIRLQVAVPLGHILLRALIPDAMGAVDWRRSVGLLS
jgi:AcrR family transcriptional regulator